MDQVIEVVEQVEEIVELDDVQLEMVGGGAPSICTRTRHHVRLIGGPVSPNGPLRPVCVFRSEQVWRPGRWQAAR